MTWQEELKEYDRRKRQRFAQVQGQCQECGTAIRLWGKREDPLKAHAHHPVSRRVGLLVGEFRLRCWLCETLAHACWHGGNIPEEYHQDFLHVRREMQTVLALFIWLGWYYHRRQLLVKKDLVAQRDKKKYFKSSPAYLKQLQRAA